MTNEVCLLTVVVLTGVDLLDLYKHNPETTVLLNPVASFRFAPSIIAQASQCSQV